MPTINNRFENLTLERLQEIYDLIIISPPGSAVWGSITGTLSAQTDLQTALNGKFNNPTGTVIQYIRGDGTLANFPTFVPPTRTITINGTAQDLSADRTWSVGTFNLPSLTSGSVLFSNGTTIAQDNANLFWDDTNNRLGIGTASPTNSFHIIGNGIRVQNLAADLATKSFDLIQGHYNNSQAAFSLFTTLSNLSQNILWIGGGSGSYNSATDIRFFTGASNTTLTGSERMRVNSSGNVLINTTTDAGYRLDVNGSVRTTGSISAASAIARGTYLNQTLVATANNDVLVGLDIQPTFTLGAFTGVTRFPLRIRNSANDGSVFGVTNDGVVRWGNRIESGNNTGQLSWDTDLVFINAAVNLGFRTGSSDRMRIFSTGNLLLQSGGTFTDAGFRLDVNGTTKLRSSVRLGSINQPSAPILTTNSPTGGTLAAATYFYRIVAVDFFGSTTTPSSELSVTTTGSTSSITLAWALVSGAYSYRIYRGTTSGGQNLYYTVTGTNTTSFTDTGAAGTAGTTPTENLTAYGSYSTSNGDFRSGNITIVNNGVGNYSSILFDKSTDTPAINVVEYGSDSTMFEFSLRDNPDGVNDFFHWVLPDWQNPSSGWKPLKFANFELQFIGSTSNFWSSFSLPSSTPYYTTNPDSLANSSIKWNPYTSNTYNLIKDSGTGTGNLNVEIAGFTGTINRIYWVTIQTGGTTFNWGINSFSTAPIGTGVVITGGWQTLDNGTQIKITGAVLAGDRWSFRAFPVPRLGIGTSAPTSPLQVSSTVQASGAIARSSFLSPTLVATANNDVLIGLDIGPVFTVGAFTGVQQENLVIRGGNNPIIRFKNAAGNTIWGQITANASELSFNAGGGSLNFTAGNTIGMYMFTATRNILIQNGGTFTDAGYRLDVNGTVRFSDTLSFTNFSSLTPQGTTAADRRLLIRGGEGGAVGSTSLITLTTNGNITSTSGNPVLVNISRDFAPTSGTATYALASITGVINQTGGANGITRGLYINPTLTAAADFRAIETTNGKVIFANLPTSSAGLPTGAIWNDAGTLKIV